MKLFVIAGLIAFCSAGRLEHLEHQQSRYLPPGQGSGNSPSGNYGVSAGGHDDDAIGAHSHASIKGTYPDQSSDKEPSASENDSEFAGYVYGPGIKNIYSQKPNQKKDNQFGDKIRNQNFGQPEDIFGQQTPQGSVEQFGKPTPQGPKQQFGQHSPQGPKQQFGQQSPQGPKQQYGQQTKYQENRYQAASQYGDDEPAASGTNSIGATYGYQPSSPDNAEHYAPHSSQNAPQQAFDETGYHY